jgi:hypothetical protein
VSGSPPSLTGDPSEILEVRLSSGPAMASSVLLILIVLASSRPRSWEMSERDA